MNKPVIAVVRHPRRGALDQQGRRREAVPVGEVCRRSGQDDRHDPVRARLVDGVAADLRPAGAGPQRLLRDGLVRGARLRHLVRRHGGLRPLDQDARQQRPDLAMAPTTASRPRPISRRCAASARSWCTGFRRARCARRCSRNGIPTWCRGSRSTPWCGPARARRRWPTAASACPSIRPRTAGRSTAPSCARSSPATIPAPPTTAWSRRLRMRSSSSTIRCRPAPTWTCARGCRCATRPRSRPRPSSCAASTTASRASQDLVKFFEKLPNPDKQFAVMPGIAHASIQQKNYAIVFHILLSFFTQPEPVYRGEH